MILVLLFIVGICFGSFSNVLIDRIPAGKSVLFGRSQCDFCKKTLGFLDLFPLFSFLFLKGRCQYCHRKLSLQYPAVEMFVGVLFVSVYLLVLPNNLLQYAQYGLDVVLASLGFALIVMDIKYHMLSDWLLLFFALFSAATILLTNPADFPMRIVIGIFSAIPLFLLFIISKGRGMGFGDVKLVAALGFLIGFPSIIIAYYVAFLTGAMSGVILILVRKKNFRGATIAFGPFLFLGAVVAILWGNSLWEYVRYFIGL